MHPLSPSLTLQLAHTRAAELHRLGQAPARPAGRRMPRPQVVRERTGWFLVGVGLRLVTGPAGAPMRVA